MKNLLLITIMSLFFMTTQAQSTHIGYQIDDQGNYFFEHTFDINSSSNELIYKSKIWLYEHFSGNYELKNFEVISPHVILATGIMHCTSVKILISTKNNQCKMKVYDINYAHKGKIGYNSTKVRDGCKDEIYLNINSYLFFKKNGDMKKQSEELFYTLHNYALGLFYSLEADLDETLYNNPEWETLLLR